ncbi:hypothetical protein BTM25_14870 [Actinomadura rubteroloni]|uniref:RHIM domain-containing protein n=1 Tax=Actinomadura rubteroloni TaxID=1926885 RepID=A0A2P4UPV6_9ACTN|nr:hypothetical protein [Actinomadura rubteroloni]POM27078.1 hypothetical protein BTM25_14870 [Actinomadura rubteroloni]
MDPVTIIVAALTAGATAGLKDTAASAVTDSYAKLKDLVGVRLSGAKTGEIVLSEHESDPGTWAVPLTKVLLESGADTDPAVLDAARHLLALVGEDAAPGVKYKVDVSGARVVYVGDHGHQDIRLPAEES